MCPMVVAEGATQRERPAPSASAALRSVLRSEWALFGIALVPFVIAIVVLLAGRSSFHPIGDVAQTELVMRRLADDPPRVGPYSRDGWFHPGPLVYYVLAVPYWLTGRTAAGLAIGAAAINGASIAGMAIIARRLGGRPLMIATLLCSAILVLSLGPEAINDPWNPTIVVLPFGLLFFVAWAMACGQALALPAGAALGSFIVQTHIGYLPLVVPLLVWGVVGLLVSRLRSASPTSSDTDAEATRPASMAARLRLGRTLVITGGVIALAWVLPVVQQTQGDPGNLGRMVDYFRASDEPGHSLLDGWRVVSTQLGVRPEWLTGVRPDALSREPLALYTGADIPVFLLVIVPAAIFLWRQGPESARRLITGLAVTTVFGVLALARTPGVAFSYRLSWTHVLGMVSGVLVVWAGWLAIKDWSAPRLRVAALATVSLVITITSVASSVDVARAGTPEAASSDRVAALAQAAEQALPPGEGDVTISSTSVLAMLYAPGLASSLDREGVDVRLPNLGDVAVTWAHRTRPGHPQRAELVLATDNEISRLTTDPSMELVHQVGTIPPPRSPDDPFGRAEAAFAAGDVAALRDLARQYAPELEVPSDAFEPSAVAVFIRREGTTSE